MTNVQTNDWLEVCGQVDRDFTSEIASANLERISSGEYSIQDIKNIAETKCQLVNRNLQLSTKDLESVRELCKLWDLQLTPIHITSHRRFIGPIIVAVKRMLFPLISMLMKETIKQQRSFNAAAVTVLTEALSRTTSSKSDIKN